MLAFLFTLIGLNTLFFFAYIEMARIHGADRGFIITLLAATASYFGCTTIGYILGKQDAEDKYKKY